MEPLAPVMAMAILFSINPFSGITKLLSKCYNHLYLRAIMAL
jgi:hypothetical protein